MSPFAPEFEGELTLDAFPDDFRERIQRRVETGLLFAGNRSRADYRIVASDGNSVTIHAHGLASVYNIGLNEVTLTRQGANGLRYHVSYWGWTQAAVAHGLILTILFVVLYLVIPQFRRDVAAYSYGFAMLWSIVGVMGLLWPWLLSALHKGPARRALIRILNETLAGTPPMKPFGRG